MGNIYKKNEVRDVDKGIRYEVMAFKSKKDIDKIKQFLLGKQDKRDYVLFVLGINIGLRTQDLVNLKVSDVSSSPKDIKKRVQVIEQKTGKIREFEINDAASNALKVYLGSLKTYEPDGCAGYHLGKDYLMGNMIRQDYLETALRWIADRDGLANVEDYMAKHQFDADASDLWVYFQNVISWVKVVFPNYRKEMKSVEWGLYYNKYHSSSFNPNVLESEIKKLYMDDDVTRKAGIYEYLIDGKEKHLSIRAFTPAMRSGAYERQNGICPKCKGKFELKDMEADHITPWSQGGTTTMDNCQMLCRDCNRKKSDI